MSVDIITAWPLKIDCLAYQLTRKRSQVETLLLLLITLINCELLKIDVDYGIIRNATCYLAWAFIGVFESFLRRVKENAIY